MFGRIDLKKSFLLGDLASASKTTFRDIYTPDGFDDHLVQYDLDAYIRTHSYPFNKDDIPQSLMSPISMVTSFFGLPNRCPEGKNQTWTNIGLNLLGWEDRDTVSTLRRNINYAKTPFVLLWNLLFIIPTTVKNIAKLVTEYLPLRIFKFFTRFTIYALNQLSYYKNEELLIANLPTTIAFAAIYVFATVGRMLFGSLHFVGQAITSPIKGVRTGWKFGEDLVSGMADGKAKKTLGVVIGGFFAALSMAATITAYTFLFPLAIKAIGTMIAGKAVPVIGEAVSALTTSAPAWLTSVGNSVVMPVLGQAFSAIGMAVSPAAAGLALIGGVAVTTVGLGVNRAVAELKKRWFLAGRREKESLEYVAPPQDSTRVMKAAMPAVVSATAARKESVHVSASVPVVQQSATGSRSVSADSKNPTLASSGFALKPPSRPIPIPGEKTADPDRPKNFKK